MATRFSKRLRGMHSEDSEAAHKRIKLEIDDVANNNVCSSEALDRANSEKQSPVLTSEYEKQRNKTMEENAEFLRSIGMLQAKTVFRSHTIKQRSPNFKKDRKTSPVGPRRTSSRIRSQPAVEYNIEKQVMPAADHEPPQKRKAEELEMLDEATVVDNNSQEESEAFIKTMKCLKRHAHIKQHRQPLDSFIEDMQQLSTSEGRVMKLTKDRIFSLCIHPTEEKIIVAAGDKWGKIGFWMKSDSIDKTYAYEPHIRPVRCLKFHPSEPSHIYSCSYDGSLRKGDFERSKFIEIFQTPAEDYTQLYHFDWLSAQELAVTTIHGELAIIDTRTPSLKAEQTYNVHQKSSRGVSVHPVHKHYIATSSIDYVASLWDMRNMKPQKPDSLQDLRHQKIVDSVFFSPISGNSLLTTSQDNTIRVFDTSVMSGVTQTRSIQHNNFTGRWLSKFQAIWHPAREDIFVVGSMAQPRRIELYSSTGGSCVHHYTDPLLGSVCSLNAIHPTRNVVAGGNSSGRLHVFM